MKKTILLFAVMLFTANLVWGLSTGDLAFTAFNADSDDDFAIVALADIPANSTIYFSDNEPNAAGTGFDDLNECVIEWVTGGAVINAGTIVVFTDVDNETNPSFGASIGTISVPVYSDDSGMGLSSSGDALYAVEGSPEFSNVTAWLAGIQNEADNQGEFFNQTGLTSGTTFIDMYTGTATPDGGYYSGTRGGQSSFSDYLPLLGNYSNWTIENSSGNNILPISTTAFTVFIGPDNPATFAAADASSTEIDLDWTQNGSSNNVLVVWTSDGIFGTPVNGSTYSAGNTITGGGTVLYYGSATHYDHINLNTSTQYFYKAWSYDGSEYSYGVTDDATTPCDQYTLPIVQGFNAETIPDCWSETVLTDPDGDAILTYVTSGSSPTCSPDEGTHMIKFNSYNCDDGDELRLKSPEFSTLEITAARVLFAWRESSGYSSYLDEGVTVQWSLDGSTWNDGTFYQRYNAANGWYDKIYDLPAGALEQSRVYIGFLFHSQYGYNCYFDDVTIEETPSCFAPTDLTATNIQQNQADLGWTDNAGASLWDIELVDAGTSPNETPTQTGVTNPYTYGSLTSQHDYEFYVRADCGAGDTSTWTGPYAFTTWCDPFTATFSENFDTTALEEMPDCWFRIVDDPSGYVKVYDVGSNSTPNNLRMYNCAEPTDNFIAVTPGLSDLTSQLNQIRFYSKTSFQSNLLIGTMSDPTNAATFTLYETIDLTSDYIEYTVIFGTGYTGSDEYIALKHGCNSNYDYMNIDDFVYEPIPACPAPSTLTASSVTLNSASLGWTDNASATSWDIEFGDSGFIPTTNPTHADIGNPCLFENLAANTTYDWYVRANCDANGYSTWTGPSSFTTLEGKATNPDPADGATGVATTYTTLDWDDVSGADSYTIDIGTTSGGHEIVDDGDCPASTYTYASDWDPSTQHYWTVTTHYNTSRTTVVGDEWDFTTGCVTVTSFPFTENFDAAQATPDCWINADPTELWEFSSSCGHGADYDHTTGSGNFAWLDDSDPNDNPSNIDTPIFDLTSLTTPFLSFWYWIGDDTNASTLYIDVFDGTSWTEGVASYTELQEWGEANLYLSAYSSVAT